MAKVPSHLNGQAFPGIYIHDGQGTKRSSVGSAKRDRGGVPTPPAPGGASERIGVGDWG